jgi:hypothetical protein
LKVVHDFRKFLTSALPLFTMMLMLFLFVPSQIYLTNPFEFSVLYSELFTYGLILSILFSVVLSPLFFLIQKKIGGYRIVSILVAICLLLYIQGSFLLWKYGPLDGSEIPWNVHTKEGIIDATVWLVVLILALWQSKWFFRYAKTFSFALVTIQCVLCLIQYQRMPEVPNFKKYSIDESNKFAFSRNKNVLIIVLDSFQTDFFQQIINEHPSFKEIFEGFIFFRNSLAGHPFTETSTMNILTGKFYEGKQAFEKHNQKVYLDHSLPAILKENGFAVEIYPANVTPFVKRGVFYNKAVLSNIKKREVSLTQLTKEMGYLVDLSLFRTLPTVFRPGIYKDQSWFISRQVKKILDLLGVNIKPIPSTRLSVSRDLLERVESIQVVNELTAKGTATRNENVLKYYHLDLPHMPLRLNEKLQYEKMKLTRRNYLRQSEATLKLVRMIFEELKRIGAYDNSLIFVIADHGAGAQGQEFQAQQGIPVPEGTHLVSQWYMINALPLFLVKPFRSKLPLKSSNAPVSLQDISATVLSEFGFSGKTEGRSVFTISESEQRTRRYLTYQRYDPIADRYLQIEDWRVKGYPWLIDSWEAGGKRRGLYRIGQNLQFHQSGNALQYTSYGWSHEPHHSWTDGTYASLAVPISPIKKSLLLRAKVAPYGVKGKLERQRVEVFVNHQHIAHWNVMAEQEELAVISLDVVHGEELKITFFLPDAKSPFDLIGAPDKRQLGLAFKALSLSEIPVYEYGTPIAFNRNGKAELYLGLGWSLPESDGIWTDGENATLSIPVPQPKSDLVLEAQVEPFLGGGKIKAQRVGVVVNNKLIANQKIATAQKFLIDIPKEIVTDGLLQIQFDLPDAQSPRELGIRKDKRYLALSFTRMRITETQ